LFRFLFRLQTGIHQISHPGTAQCSRQADTVDQELPLGGEQVAAGFKIRTLGSQYRQIIVQPGPQMGN